MSWHQHPPRGAPRLTRRLGNGILLAAGLATTMIGMFWLGQLTADTPLPHRPRLPVILAGAGQGASLGPLTAGIAGVQPHDAGAASGLVNVAHQLGGSLGLGILAAVFAAAGAATLDATHLFAHRAALVPLTS